MSAMPNENPPGLRELLAFYAQAGVDEPLDDEPVNRFAEARRPISPLEEETAAKQPEGGGRGSAARKAVPGTAGATAPGGFAAALPPRGREAPPKAAVPDDTQVGLARELAANAATLDALREAMSGFEGCNLKLTAKNLVFADGNPEAELMLVGEAPGRDEDLEGLPFIGRSGQLLDRMLAAIGLDRQSAYIANVIPWRPPGNRTPTPQETEICRPFIERQIELVQPRVLITLGGPSAKLLLNATEGILRLRGAWKTHVTASGVAIPAMPTLHPAYLLRTPAHKKLAWRDLLEVKAHLARRDVV